MKQCQIVSCTHVHTSNSTAKPAAIRGERQTIREILIENHVSEREIYELPWLMFVCSFVHLPVCFLVFSFISSAGGNFFVSLDHGRRGEKWVIPPIMQPTYFRFLLFQKQCSESVKSRCSARPWCEPMLLTMGGEGPREGFRLRLSDPTLGHVLSSNNYLGSEDSEEESSGSIRLSDWPRSCAAPVSFLFGHLTRVIDVVINLNKYN